MVDKFQEKKKTNQKIPPPPQKKKPNFLPELGCGDITLESWEVSRNDGPQ